MTLNHCKITNCIPFFLFTLLDWATRVKQIAKLWRKASSQERAPYVVINASDFFLKKRENMFYLWLLLSDLIVSRFKTAKKDTA